MNDSIRDAQEVKLKVLPLSKLRFIYIIEDTLKLLFELRNPKTTILGWRHMTLSYSNNDES